MAKAATAITIPFINTPLGFNSILRTSPLEDLPAKQTLAAHFPML
jgi:hypothetical protein